MTRRPLALALAAAFGCHGPCLPAAAETVLGTVSVEAEAPEEAVDETAAITSITAEQISRDMAISIKDAVRYEPGVSVSNNPSRFGLAGFNIRGVDGDRVAMQIDGVRLPDEFKTGGFSNAGRNLVDVRLLKKIDIQRGSSSVMYGSGALGGAVNYVTPDPEDYLDATRSVGGRVEAQYFSANDARALIPVVAAGSDTVKLLIAGVAQQATEAETMGTNYSATSARTAANPQDDALRSGLVKLVFTPRAHLRTALVADIYQRDVDTHILSQVGGVTTDLHGEDRYRRSRFSLEQRVSDLPIGTLDMQIYTQRSNTHQDTFDTRRTGGQNVWQDAMRIFDYDQDSIGLRILGDSTFERAGAHRLRWGFDVSQRETEQIRDGFTRIYLTGDLDKQCFAENPPGSGNSFCPPFPEVNQVNGQPYPDRDFPLSTVRELGIFAQDNWILSDVWSLTFGLRYDQQRLRIAPDAIYLDPDADGIDKPSPAPVSNDAWSPKIAATWRFRPDYALSLGYSWGFRAPPYDSVNFGFANTQLGYMTEPSPDLRPEYSRSTEIKLERTTASLKWSATAYYTRYVDFIELETLCPGSLPECSTLPPGITQLFKSVNLPNATIQGFEASLQQRIGDHWRMRGSLTYTHGRDLNDNPIDSIDPLKGVIGLAYARPTWEVEAVLTLVDAKHERDARVETSVLTGSTRIRRQFLPDGYGALDLRAHWQFAKTGRASFGVLNVFDKKYVQWADVPVYDPNHVRDSGRGPDRYSQPGRNFAVSLNYDFK